ncbi:MAG TPA: type II secretion system protein GspD, partial [Gammaproteobacteria bacterium]|nr:type II secretion system protein GspD [Gammaproteobacteria bacterium]
MLLLLGSQAIRAEQPKSLLNLNDADIRALIGTVSKATGRNFVVDPRVKGKVTVISSTPTESADIYELFLSILQVNGFSAIETNDVVKIVPLTGATQQGTPATGEQDESPDSLVTRLFTLNHTSAAELVPILRPLLPQHAHLAAHTASNALIAADSSANIGRLATLVARIDQPLDRAIEIVRLENASASDLVPILQGMVATK